MIKIVKSWTSQQIQEQQNQLVHIYRQAFSSPPYNKDEIEVADFAYFLPQHVMRDGFQMVAAMEEQNNEVVGFAYGFANTSDQFFYQEVAKVTNSDFVMAWLSDYFRLVEIAVLPRVQGRGIGGALHNHLLSGLPQAKGILATIAAETDAFRLYRKRGWQVLLEEIFFTGVTRPYRIMGMKLVPPELAVD